MVYGHGSVVPTMTELTERKASQSSTQPPERLRDLRKRVERSLPGLLSPLAKLCAYGLLYALPIGGLFAWVLYKEGSLKPIIEVLLGITNPYDLNAPIEAVGLALLSLLVAPAFIGAVAALIIEHRLDRSRKEPAEVIRDVMRRYPKLGGSAATGRPRGAKTRLLIRRLSKVAEDSTASSEFVSRLLDACDGGWALAEEVWEELNSAMFACVDPAANRAQRLKGAETMTRVTLMSLLAAETASTG